jgi:predicted RNA methylase
MATFAWLASLHRTDATPVDVSAPDITPPDVIAPSVVDDAEAAAEAAREHAQGLSQWFTPPWLAAEVVALLDVRGLVVLEPSAGDGAIVEELLAAGAREVVAVEIDPVMADKLRARFAGRPVRVICADFLTVELDVCEFDAVAGNIPYDKGADTQHLTRLVGILEPREIEAAILMRTVTVHSAKRYERVWKRLAVRHIRACVDRIPFPLGGGPVGDAGKIDVSIFRIGPRRPGEIEPFTWLREPGRAA